MSGSKNCVKNGSPMRCLPAKEWKSRSRRQEGIRFGATLVLPVDRYHFVKLYSISGYNAHREHDFQAFGIAWQYRWGGGF